MSSSDEDTPYIRLAPNIVFIPGVEVSIVECPCCGEDFADEYFLADHKHRCPERFKRE